MSADSAESPGAYRMCPSAQSDMAEAILFRRSRRKPRASSHPLPGNARVSEQSGRPWRLI